MSGKIKIQLTIGDMYGWKKGKTSNIENDSNTSEEVYNTQLQQQFDEIFGSLSDEETNEVEEEVDNHKKMKVQTKRKFRMEWLDKFDWLNYVRRDDKIYMKCKYCEKYRMSGPRGLGNGCGFV